MENIYKCVKQGGLVLFDTRNFDKMILENPKFLPMRINAQKDGKIVSVLYVFDYIDNIIRFNIVYLIEDKESGNKKMEVEIVDYNPIKKQKLIDFMKQVGFKDIVASDEGPNINYSAIK